MCSVNNPNNNILIFFPRRWQVSILFEVMLTSIAFNISRTFYPSYLSFNDQGIIEISTLFPHLYWSMLLLLISKLLISFSQTYTLVLRHLFSFWRFSIFISFKLITSSSKLVRFCIKLISTLERANGRSGGSPLIVSLLLMWYSWLPMSEIVTIWFNNSIVKLI